MPGNKEYPESILVIEDDVTLHSIMVEGARVNPGQNERTRERSTYKVFYTLNAFDEQRNTSNFVSTEREFRSWSLGDQTQGDFSRCTGLSEMQR